MLIKGYSAIQRSIFQLGKSQNASRGRNLRGSVAKASVQKRQKQVAERTVSNSASTRNGTNAVHEELSELDSLFSL